MKQLRLSITTLSPVILTARSNSAIMTDTNDYFSGSIVRGIIANQYIKAKSLGTDAHEDADFRRLFFDRLRFLPAYPIINGERSFPLPFSLAKNKSGSEACDLLVTDAGQGFKGCRGFGTLQKNTITKAEIKKNLELHMSRSDVSAKQAENHDKIGKERLAGKSSEHGIYNYESIDAAQTFIASIIGEEADLTRLRETIPHGFTALTGRSRLTQYGECSIKIEGLSDIPDTHIPQADTLYLRLDTPLIPTNPLSGSFAEIIGEEILSVLNDGNDAAKIQLSAKPRKHFAATTEIDNFVRIWAMKRPRITALEAGSVFTLEKAGGFTENDCQKIQELAEKGVGIRTEEGFGQLRLWQPPKALTFAEKAETRSDKDLSLHKPLTRKASELALSIINRRFLEALRALAAIDAKSDTVSGLSKEQTHFFSKLDSLLQAKSTCQAFNDELTALTSTEDGGNNKPITKHLNSVKLDGLSLKKLLALPLSEAPHMKNRPELSALLESFEEISGEIKAAGNPPRLSEDKAYSTYWQWFFRYIRKRCQEQKLKEGDNK